RRTAGEREFEPAVGAALGHAPARGRLVDEPETQRALASRLAARWNFGGGVALIRHLSADRLALDRERDGDRSLRTMRDRVVDQLCDDGREIDQVPGGKRLREALAERLTGAPAGLRVRRQDQPELLWLCGPAAGLHRPS